MLLTRFSRVALVLAVPIAGQPTALYAECVRIPLQSSQQRPVLMFSGTVKGVEVVAAGGGFMITVDVDQVWKGRLHRVTKLYQWLEGKAKLPEVGRRYMYVVPKYAVLDFRDKRRDPLDVPGAASCGWGVPYENVERELSTLRRPHKP